MLAVIRSTCPVGIDAIPIDVEVQAVRGKADFSIIGMGGHAVRESGGRIMAALHHSGFDPLQQVLVNLAPAEVRKESSSVDLPIALGLLCASGILKSSILDKTVVHGELSLDGSVKPMSGALAAAVEALRQGAKRLVIPLANAYETSLVGELEVIGVRTLGEAVAILTGRRAPHQIPRVHAKQYKPTGDLSEVRGQERALKALTIAACGGHNLLFVGPPGCGKSMLAERLPTILPPLSDEERLDAVKIYSASGLPIEPILSRVRPFRAPHHIISDVGLIGGGAVPKPGEISLAHRGVLFLDEFPEFRRVTLEALRSPMEAGTVTISRAKASVKLPADFQLVAAMNPCPCGRLGGTNGTKCRCSRAAVTSYLARLSQPILDRIDLHVELEPVGLETLTKKETTGESSNSIFQRVLETREVQIRRQGCLNARLGPAELREKAGVEKESEELLLKAGRSLNLSARGLSRILRTARTIADLNRASNVTKGHIAEAIGFRTLEHLSKMINGGV